MDFSNFLEEHARVDLNVNTLKIRPRKKNGKKKAKVDRALRREISKEAEKKFQEMLRLIKKAKANDRGAVSLLITCTRGRTIPEKEVRLTRKISLLLRKREGLKSKLETRSTSFQDSDESDDDPGSCGAGFASYLVVTGFLKY